VENEIKGQEYTFDDLEKSLNFRFSVIPAKAEIQYS